MAKGGARPGGGRKKGGINKRTAALRAVADRAIESGMSPLDIMLDNMRFYASRAEELYQHVGELVDRSDKNAVFALRSFGEARMKAQQCATEAANYVHPRLSAVAVRGGGGDGLAMFNLILFQSGEQPQVVNQQKLINGKANGNGSAY